MADPVENGPKRNEQIRQIESQLQNKTPQQVREEFNAAEATVAELRREIESNSDALLVNRELPDSIRQSTNDKMPKLQNIVEVIKQTIVAANYPNRDKLDLPPGKSGDVIRSVAREFQSLSDINERSSIYVYEIIKRGLDGQLESVDQLISAFESIKNLKYLHENVYDRIAIVFRQEAEEQGASEIQLNKLKTIKGNEGRLDQTKLVDINTKQLQAEYGGILSQGRSMIESLPIRFDNNSEFVRNLRASVDVPGLSAEEKERFIQEKLNEEKQRITGRLITQFNSICQVQGEPPKDLDAQEMAKWRRDIWLNTSLNSNGVLANKNRFLGELDRLSALGIINPGDYTTLHNLADALGNNADKYIGLQNAYKQEGFGLFEEAERLFHNEWKDHRDLLNALNNVSSFKEYIGQKYNNFDRPEDWEEFNVSVRRLFEKLLVTAESQPKDYWQQSFNEFHEGHLYKQFVKALRNIGSELDKDPRFNSKKVQVWTFYAKEEDPGLIDLPGVEGHSTLSAKRKVNLNLGAAIRGALTNEMIDLKDVTEFSHNVNVLTQQGLGFDKLAEFSSRIRMHDIDRIIKRSPGLSDAYNMYLENMQVNLGINFHIFPVDFGRQDIIYGNLDPVEFETFNQMKASRKFREEFKGRYPNDEDLQRLIRMASSLSKGVFGEFWGTAWTARMPLDITRVEDERTKELLLRVNRSYKSLSMPGIEKMLTSIDFDLNLQRFNIPRLLPEVRYAYAPREWGDKEIWEVEKDMLFFRHTDIYKIKDRVENAKMNGRNDEQADFDDKYVLMQDFTRTSSIDYGLRESWRYYDYRRFIVYKKKRNEKRELVDETVKVKKKDKHTGKETETVTDKKVIDFEATMRLLQGIGPQAVKIFINDLFGTPYYQDSDVSDISIKQISKSVIKEYEEHLKKYGDRNWTAENDLNKKQESELKTLFYDKFIFQPLAERRPTHFLAMEDRRWMPEDEVKGGRTLYDQCFDYLWGVYKGKYDKQYIQSNILPLYIGALQVVEKDMWDMQKQTWKNMRDDNTLLTDPKDPLDYRLEERNFEQAEINDSLREYYRLKKEAVGLEPTQGGKDLFLDDENFLKNVKGFFTTLNNGINAQRWNRVKPTDEKKAKALEETLAYRYARMLTKKQGYVDHYIKGNFLDLDEFCFSTSGSRGTERMLGETMKIQTEVTPALSTIYFTAVSQFVRIKFKDDHAVEAEARRLFGEPFKKINSAIALIDQDQAWEYEKHHLFFLATLLGSDRLYRAAVIGPMLALRNRLIDGRQQSYVTDQIPETNIQSSKALNSSELERFVRGVAETIDMPREKHKVIGSENFKLFGKEIKIFGRPIPIPGKQIYDQHGRKHNTEQIIKGLGLERKFQLIESIPAALPILAFLLFLYLKLAADKDKKKG